MKEESEQLEPAVMSSVEFHAYIVNMLGSYCVYKAHPMSINNFEKVLGLHHSKIDLHV